MAFDPFAAGAEPVDDAAAQAPSANAFDPFAAGAEPLEPTKFDPFAAGAEPVLEEHKPKFTTFEEFVAPVGQAFANLPARGAQVRDFVKLLFQKPVDELTGDFGPSIAIAEEMSKRSQRLAADRAVVVEASGAAGGVASDVATAAVDLIPQLLLSGGVGLLSTAKQAITTSAALGGLQSAANSFAGNVSERIAKGEEAGAAAEAEFVPSLASGAITGIVTKAFGAGGVESVFKEIGGRGVAAKMFGVLKEAGSEASEEMIDEAGQWINDLVNTKGVTLGDAVNRVAYAGFLGGVLGGGVAGMHRAVTSFRPDIVQAEGAVSRARTIAPQTAGALEKEVATSIAEAEVALTPAAAAEIAPLAAPVMRGGEPETPIAETPVPENILSKGVLGETHQQLADQILKNPDAKPEDVDAAIAAGTDKTLGGFTDSEGNVKNRNQSARLAVAAGQIKPEFLKFYVAGKEDSWSLESQHLQEATVAGNKIEGPALLRAAIAAAPQPEVIAPQPEVIAPQPTVPPVIPSTPIPEPAAPPTEREVAIANARTPEEKAAQLETGTTEVRATVTRTGIVPAYAELQKALGNPAEAKKLRAALQAEVAAAYPAEAPPEGATVSTTKNALTGDSLPSVNEGGKLRPQFTNDPNLTAQQIDLGQVGTDKANRMYVPDEIMDNDQLNPAIDTAYDKEAGKFYITAVNSEYGRAEKPDDFATPYKAAKTYQKAHQLVLAGGTTEVQQLQEFVAPEENSVGQALTENGFAPDAIRFEPDEQDVPLGEVAVAGGVTATTQEAGQMIAALQQLGLVDPTTGRTEAAPNAVANMLQLITSKAIPAASWMRIMAQHLIDSGIDLSKVGVVLVNRPNAGYAGSYRADPTDLSQGRIRLNVAKFHEGGIASTVFHELFHHATLVKADPNYKRNSAEQKAYDSLQELYAHAVQEIFKMNYGHYGTPEEVDQFRREQAAGSQSAQSPASNRTYYGLSRFEEFISEVLANPKFMKALSQIKGLPNIKTGGRFANLLAAVREYIKRMFLGTSTRNSTMNQAVDQAMSFIGAGVVEHSRATGTVFAADSAARNLLDLSRDELEAEGKRIGLSDVDMLQMTTGEIRGFITGGAPEPVATTSKITDDGWLGPDGKFHPAPMSEGGHENIANNMIHEDPSLLDAFYAEGQARMARAERGEEIKADAVYAFMEKRGFVRVVSGGPGGTMYVTGKPSRAQRQILMDNAIEQKATLVQDFGGTRNRTLFSPDEAFSAPGNRRSTTALAGALESASPFVQSSLKDTTYLSGNNAEDLAAVKLFIDENTNAGAQLGELVDMLDIDQDSRFPTIKLDDVQRGLARIQIARAADNMAAQLADNIANNRPVTDIHGRTVGIDGPGQALLVQHYQDIAIEQNRIAQIELSRSASYLSRVGALIAKTFTPAKAKADYAGPIKSVQQTALRTDPEAKGIRAAFEAVRQEAATIATDKADKVIQLVTGLTQDSFNFFEEVFGKGTMEKSSQWLTRYVAGGSGPPVTVDIANDIAAQMVKTLSPKPTKTTPPTPALALLQAEVQKQVALQIEAALPKSAPAPVVRAAIETFIRDTDHAELMERAFNTAAGAIRNDPNVPDATKAAMVGAKFDLGKLKSAQELVRQYLTLKDVVHQNLSSQEATRDNLIHDILEQAPHLSEAQTGAVVKALTSAFDLASQQELRTQLGRLTRTRGPAKPITNRTEDYLKLARFGAYSDAALYNLIALNNPQLKLPVYDPAFLAKLDRESQLIMRMPEDSDLRRTAVTKLNGDIANEQVKNLKGWAKAWHYISQVGPAVWQAGVLSGPPTQLVNLGATATNVQGQAFFSALGYATAAVRAGAPISQVGNFFADGVMGWFNQGKSRTEFRRALTTGISKFRSERGEGASILETLSPKNPYGLGKWVLRLATASDGFNSTNANEIKQRMALRYSMLIEGKSAAEIDAAVSDAFNPSKEVYDQILEQVAQEADTGLLTTELNKEVRINELLEKRRNDIQPGLIEESRATAEEWTFNGQPKGVAGLVFDGAIGSMNRAFPPAKFFFSFMRTMANLLNTTLDFSPVGVARAYNFHVSGGLSKTSRFRYVDLQRGSPEFYAKLGQGVAGTAAIFALAAMAMKGLEDEEDGKEPFFGVYGAGPSTAIERRQLIEGAGWQPNSIKIGSHRFNYTDWPVLNLALGAIGTLADDVRFKRNADTEGGERAMLLALGLMNVIMSKRLLQGASNLFTVIQNPDQRGINAAKQITSGIVGGFTNPQALKWARNTLGMGEDGMVPVLDASTTKGWLYSMMPASVGYNQAGLNVLGEEVKEFPWVATTKRFGVFDPVKPHPVLTPLVSNGLMVPPPNKNVAIAIKDQIIPMGRNPELYRQFVKYRGDALKKILTPEQIERLTGMEQSAAQDLLKGTVNTKANNEAKRKITADIKAGRLTVDFQKPNEKMRKQETTEPTP